MSEAAPFVNGSNLAALIPTDKHLMFVPAREEFGPELLTTPPDTGPMAPVIRSTVVPVDRTPK